MPCLWLQHNNSQLFVNVAIIDAAAVNVQAVAAGGANQLATPPRMFVALVDTGAQKTMISTNVVNALSLQPQGQIAIQGVGPNITYHNAYLFHVAFTMAIGGQPVPPAGQRAMIVHINSNVIYGAELTVPPGAQATFDVLLGMDILSSGLLHIGGNGHYSFSF